MTLSPEYEDLFKKIQDSTGDDARRGAHTARVHALLVRDLSASLAALHDELGLTRDQMAVSSAAAAQHQQALVRWSAMLTGATVVMALATIAYAVAAFLPYFKPPLASPVASSRAWVLWSQTRVTTARPPATDTWEIAAVFDTRAPCDAELSAQQQAHRQASGYDASTRTMTAMRHVCYPDTVDPRGPKAK